MTRFATWLGDVLRDAGLVVHELHGWRTRSTRSTGLDVHGVVAHHTATGPNWTDHRVDNLLRDGRSDLPGPLSQLGLRRDGSYVVVAAGRANHNGHGVWGNDSIGIEAYNDGRGEPWPAVQVDAYQRGAAAILGHLGMGAGQVRGHRETDPGRKIDPRGLDMDQFRARVAYHLTAPPTPKEDDMGDYARLIELAYLEANVTDSAGQSYWCRLLRTHPNGPAFVVDECRRQLKLAPIAS